jgi:hypothetical protein
MDSTNDQHRSKGLNWSYSFAIFVTLIHGASFLSWILLSLIRSDLEHKELTALFSKYWVIPEFIGLRWFTGILLLSSLVAIIILGRRVDQKKGVGSIILLVLNLCFFLMSGWSLL